jgi:hypothetical protein
MMKPCEARLAAQLFARQIIHDMLADDSEIDLNAEFPDTEEQAMIRHELQQLAEVLNGGFNPRVILDLRCGIVCQPMKLPRKE